jgi:hypothetical protein
MVTRGNFRVRGQNGEPDKVDASYNDDPSELFDEATYLNYNGRPPLDDLGWAD